MSGLLNKSEMTEEDIKLRYITPAIECKWDRHSQMIMEHSFTDGRIIVQGNTVARGTAEAERKQIIFFTTNAIFPLL